MITRWSKVLVLAASVAATAVLLAAPPTPPKTTTGTTPPKSTTVKPVTNPALAGIHPTIPVIPDHPGVHINSVRIQGNCRQNATFVVEIQNNLRIAANAGDVFIKIQNRSSQARFTNLRPGERRTVMIPTSFFIVCESGELNVPMCYEAFISMEPDATAAGQVWDGVYHTVCESTPTTAGSQVPIVTDTQHK